MTPSLDEIRAFWEAHPVGEDDIGPDRTLYDYFRSFDDLREAADVEPYAYSNFIHDYEGSSGKRVLDYGCGNGYVLAHYARNGATVAGLDITDAAIRLAEARFRLLGLEGTFARNDGLTIPFDSNSFDVACAMGVLHHIPDPGPVVSELHRVLKPGGTLIVMLYHQRSFRRVVVHLWRRRFGSAPYRGRELSEILNMNNGDANPLARAYTREEARRLLASFERHEFHVNKLGPDELALYSRRLGGVFRRVLPPPLVRLAASRFGWNLYCIAYKPLG